VCGVHRLRRSSCNIIPAPMAPKVDAQLATVAAKAVGVQKPKRKKASRACSHCQKAHLTCDDARPCARCVKKGLGASCTDGQRKKAKYLLEEDELQERRASEERAQATAAARLVQEGVSANLPLPQSADTSMEDPSNILFQTTAGLPSYTGTVSFDSPASAATGPSGGGGDGAYASMLESDPTFGGPSFHPFGTENASLEYSMLSSMIYGSGIDPTLLGAGFDDLGLSHSALYTDALPSPGTALHLTPSIGQDMYDGTSGGAGVGAVMYDGTSGGAGVSTSNSPWATTLQVPESTGAGAGVGTITQAGLFDPSVASALANMTSPPLPSGSQFGPTPEMAAVAAASMLNPMVSAGPAHSNAVASVPTSMMTPFPVPTQPLALQKFAHASTGAQQSSPDPGVPLNQLLRLRPEEEDWDTRIQRVHTDRMEPFHYTDGYHFLIEYVTANYEREEALRVVRALAIIRPSLIALQMPLSEEDEIFVERSIQRMALEFEKLIAFSGTPTVVWRRTCEICVVGSEFSMLTQWPREELIGKHIYQFLDKGSTIEYWEKFAMHAFENTSQSVVTRCVLLTPQGAPVPCSACFSIKRDMFDLPSLIVGNFLPIL